MTIHEKKIRQWREKYLELQAAAKGTESGKRRNTMFMVADAYKRMADHEETYGGKIEPLPIE